MAPLFFAGKPLVAPRLAIQVLRPPETAGQVGVQRESSSSSSAAPSRTCIAASFRNGSVIGFRVALCWFFATQVLPTSCWSAGLPLAGGLFPPGWRSGFFALDALAAYFILGHCVLPNFGEYICEVTSWVLYVFTATGRACCRIGRGRWGPSRL